MANVYSNQSDHDNKPKTAKYYPSSTLKCCNFNYDPLQKNTMHYHYRTNHLKILHQNVRGLSHKTDEFLISLLPNLPQILCLTEHHLRTEEIAKTNPDQYTLGAQFWRQRHKQGGVCIYVSNNINLEQYIIEKDLEICALKIRTLSNSFIILGIYRSPTGNFNYFLNQLESILNKLYKVSTDLIICGDFNINHLSDTPRKLLLESLLASYNLFSTVKFPTRILNNSSTLIDNIYINMNRYDFLVSPLINGLSDHDAQILNLTLPTSTTPKRIFSSSRRIDSDSIFKFQDLLSYENWEDVFMDNYVNRLFNNFLNTYFKIFMHAFQP
jgi:exonuclease III